MYTDEPVGKKDVAPGQNFSRFSLLTKITVFGLLRNPTADDSQGSWPWGSNPKQFQGLHRARTFNLVFIIRKASMKQLPLRY
jgi:hypothetical protein